MLLFFSFPLHHRYFPYYMGLDTADLIHKVEMRFAISIPNREAAAIRTVADVYQTVVKHLPDNDNPSELYSSVREIIAEQAGVDVHQIEPHQSLTNDLGMD